MTQIAIAQSYPTRSISSSDLLSSSPSSSPSSPIQQQQTQPNTNGNPAINVILLNVHLNKDEEKMTLGQLLICFPEVPSNIPCQPLNSNQHKLRRDTVVSPPVITSKASSLVDAPNKPTSIPLSASIHNLQALNTSTTNLHSLLNNSSSSLSSSSVNNNNNNNNNLINSSTEEAFLPPSTSTLLAYQHQNISPTPNIPDNLSESSSCSISSNTSNIIVQSPAKVSLNSICLANSQSTEHTQNNNNNNPDILITSNNPIPLPPSTSTSPSSTPPPTRNNQSSTPSTPTSNIMPTSPSTSSTSSTPTSPSTSTTSSPIQASNPIKLPPSSPQTISQNNISRKTQMPNATNNSTVVNNKNLNNASPTSSQQHSSSFSPTKRLTIAFGSLTRSNNSIPTESSIVPIKWEINLNQNKIVTSPPPPITTTTTTNNTQQPPSLYDQYYKLCKGDYQQNTTIYNKTFNQLLETDVNTSLSILDKCYDSILKNGGSGLLSSKDQYITKDSNGKEQRVKSLFSAMKNAVTEDIVNVKPSKSMLYFGSFGKTIPINLEVVDELILNNFSSKKVKFKVLTGPNSKSHQINVSEKEGFINKKSSLILNFSLVLKSSIKLRRIIIIEIEGGIKYFILVQIESNKTAFGQAIEDSELVEDNTSFGPMLVPRALVVLKQAFFSCDAHLTDSIFRLSPQSDTEYNICKDRVNREAIGTTEPHCIATLLKVFFRELPNLLLNDIDPQIFLNFKPTTAQSADTASSASNNRNTTSSGSSNNSNNSGVNEESNMDPVFIVNLIEEKKRSTFLWLIDLLTEITKYETINKMNSKSLAIIFSPNLYFAPTVTSVEDSFAISGKVVSFIIELILFNKSIQ